MKMKVICAWCQRDLGTKEYQNSDQTDEELISHGLCPECKVKVMAEIDRAFAEDVKTN